MPNKNKSAVMFIMDRSGSMDSIRRDMEQAMRTIVNDLRTTVKQDGTEITIDLVEFDDVITHVNKFTPVQDFTFALRPNGMTALYDAIVTGANNLREGIDKLDEDDRPGIVQVVVVTDGHENSSQVADAHLVADTVAFSTDNYGWDWTFLGANQDAVYVGEALGFEGKKSMTFGSTAAGVAGAQTSLSSYIQSTLRGEDAGYSDSDRKDASGH